MISAVEGEEAAADPAGGQGRLLVELGDDVAVDVHLAVPAGRVDAGDGAEPARRQVLLDQAVDVDVADAVTVGEQEGVGVEVVGHPPDAGAGAGQQTGLDEGDLPVLERRRAGGTAAVRRRPSSRVKSFRCSR